MMTTKPSKAAYKRSRPQKPGKAYRQLWRMVEGAVNNAFEAHPEYLSEAGAVNKSARMSVTKRVVGALIGYAGEKS